MRILVLVKEVPDMNLVKFDSEKGTVNRKGAPAELNPFDESALECALMLKEENENVTVTTLSMGMLRAMDTLRDTYARGADDTVLLSSKELGGSDTLATSKALAEAAKKVGFDLIIAGEKSVDGDTAQVGAEVAQLLDIPHAYYVDKADLNENLIVCEIENLSGSRQIREMKLPALIGVTKNIGKLRLPTVNRRLESLDKEFRILSLGDLPDLRPEDVGFHGSPTKVAEINVPKAPERESRIYADDLTGFTSFCVKQLKERGVL